MDKSELQEILSKHKLWLNNEGGQRANLKGVDLQGAELEGANLQGAILPLANMRGAYLLGANMRGANLRRADLREADLQWADLQGAELREVDLRETNLDFSCLPLWCGSKYMKVDSRIAQQLAAHFCALDCDDETYIKARDAILDFARGSHVAEYMLESEDECTQEKS